MVEVLGNKLKINSIDIIPSNIDKYNEYLKVSEDETSYELVNNTTVFDSLHLSYDKNACMNNGVEKLIDTSSVGTINFNVSESNPLVVTFPNRQQKIFTSISSLDNTQTIAQNLFLKEDGSTYLLNNRIYHQSDEPNNASTNDIWYDLAQEPLKIYQRSGNAWIDFNDVFMGVINQDLNVSVYGSVNINGGWASNFSATNYFEFANPTTNITSFVYKSKFRTGTVSGRQSILSSTKDFQGLADICIEKENNLIIWISSTGASTHDIASALLSPYAFQPNTIYWLEFAWDGLTYTTKISTDGINWTNLHSISSSLKPYWTTRLRMGNDQTTPSDIFTGSYYIPECSLTVNDQLWWKGSDKHFSQNAYNNNFTTKSVDDIWVIDDKRVKTKINADVVGSLNISDNGVVEGFSASDYGLISSYPTNISNYEIVTKFTVGTLTATHQGILGNTTTNRATPQIAVTSSNNLEPAHPTNSSTWTIPGVVAVTANTTYWGRMVWDGSTVYSYYKTSADNDWILIGSAASDSVYWVEPIGIGIDQTINVFNGSVDLSQSYIKINDEMWWKGVDYISDITHNLNIQDTSKYNASTKLICLSDDAGYKAGDIINVACYLNKDIIGTNKVSVLNKETSKETLIDISKWKFKYNIREL